MSLKIEVMSQFLFDENMREMNLNDNNVENTEMAFISIIGTKECLVYYLDERDTKHYFNDEHKNVLNLDFDDTEADVMYHGHHFKAIRMKDAENTVNFIERVINEDNVKTIKIHCRAGFSRSRAIGEFIYRYCVEHNIDVDYEDRDIYLPKLNYDVLRKLNHAYWKKHRMNGYEDENVDYPKEFIDISIITV